MKKLTKQILKEMVLVELSSVGLLSENAATEFKDTMKVLNNYAEGTYQEAQRAFHDGQGDIPKAISIMQELLTEEFWDQYENNVWVREGDDGNWIGKEWTPRLKRSFEKMKRKWAQFAKKKIKIVKKAIADKAAQEAPKEADVKAPSEEEATFALSPQHQRQKLRSDKKKLKAAQDELNDSLDALEEVTDELAACQKARNCDARRVAELKNLKAGGEDAINDQEEKISDLKVDIDTGAELVKKNRGKRRIGLRRKHAFPTAADFKKLGGTVFKNFEDFYAEVAKNPEAAKALCRFRDGKCRLRKGGRDKRWGRSHWEAWGILTQPKVTAAEPAVAAEPAAGTRRKREPLATAKKNYDFSKIDKKLASVSPDILKQLLAKYKEMKKIAGRTTGNSKYLNALIKHIEKKME